MLIRGMTTEDIPQVAKIETECFSVPWSEKSFADSLKREDTIFLVCEEEKNKEIHDIHGENSEKLQNEPNISDKKIIGYIGMYLSFEEGEITNVAVTSSARKKGVGNALINAIKEFAKQQNIQRIILEVRASNTPAITLYEKNGFVFVGKRKNFYEKPVEDANIMICEMK